MKKFLFISNSFGVDSTRYLYGIARGAKKDIKVATLYIGGCSLYRHYRNMLSEEKAYEFYLNGANSGIRVSLKEALLLDEWDVVATQQCSPDSGEAQTYFPYVNELAALVRRYAPKTKIYIHETWSYVEGSPRFEAINCANQRDMYEKLHAAYAGAAEAIGADGVIPCGSAFQRLLAKGATELHRDGAHAGLGLGRLTLSATWVTALTGKDLRGMDWSSLPMNVTADDIRMAQEAAYEACQGMN